MGPITFRCIQKQSDNGMKFTGALMIKLLLGKFIGTILFMVVLTGCVTQTGDLTNYPIQEIFDTSDGSKVTLVMGEGKLILNAGDDHLVKGTIQNNFKDWNPSIQRSIIPRLSRIPYTSILVLVYYTTGSISWIGIFIPSWCLEIFPSLEISSSLLGD